MKIKKTVVIHVDALRREFLSAWLLGEYFKKKGYNILLTSRHSSERILKFLKPDIFISSHVFLLTPMQWKNVISKGTKVYINEAEGTSHLHGVSTTYPETYNNQKIDYSLFSAIFVWGDYSYNFLIKNRKIDSGKVYLNGSTRQSSMSRPKRNTDKLVVGIISRFEIINPFDNRHSFVNLMNLDPENPDWKWYYERCAVDSEAFSITSKLISKLIKLGYYVSMRAHPNESTDSYKLLKKKFGKFFEVDKSLSINEWLNNVSVVVGTTSTAFTEPYLAKIPIISTSKIQNFHYSGDYQFHDNFDLPAYHPKTIDEMVELCTNPELAAKSSKELDEFLNSFYSLENKTDPIVKIVDVVSNENKNGSTKINYTIAKFFLYVLDIIFIIKNLIINFKEISTKTNYNYIRFLHKPTLFMMNILNKKMFKN